MSDLRLWPWRPRPQADELLSSWLRRIALGNSAKLHSFCHAVWPGLQIWNRDIDGLAPPRLMEGLVAHPSASSVRALIINLAFSWSASKTARALPIPVDAPVITPANPVFSF